MASFGSRAESWNRQLHYYLGLYFLFFLWLFSLTGLMLNHQSWFPRLYERSETKYDVVIETPAGASNPERAADVMRQLSLAGEIEFPAAQPVHHLDFTVARPDRAAQIRVDLPAKRAYVREFTNTPLHAAQVFHTFSGSRIGQPDSRRDWVLTTAWVVAMDALAAGLIIMVLGSYYMWWRLKRSHALGWLMLGSGAVICGLFLFV